MPYYAWRGVNIFGDFKTGKSFARSPEDLDKKLFSRNIALTSFKKSRIFRFLNRISGDEIIVFLRQLATLLNSGVRLPDALMILCDQTKNIAFKQVIFELESDVISGFSLSHAMGKNLGVFGHECIQIVHVGQESGNLSGCLDLLCDYLEQRETFYKKLRSAAVLPAITFAFFLLVVFGIFVFIVPKFSEIFISMGKQLPPLTQMVFGFSNFLCSYNILFFIFILAISYFLVKIFLKFKRVKFFIDNFLLKLPIFGEIYCNNILVNFLRAVSILLKGGIGLVQAIEISKKSIKNNAILSTVCDIEQDVFAGSALSQAIVDYGREFFPQDLVAMVKVGEESALLDVMLERAAFVYWQKISRSIFFFTTIFQPLLMVALGLLVTLLIFAIYVPIFNLASIV